jgi:uncharacterized UPF0146 family protein
VETALREALVSRLRRYDSLVEIGVGRVPEVAESLVAAGADVTATDVRRFEVPPGVEFVEDDVVAASERDDPGPTYRVDAVYALNLPPELHRPARDVARAVDADFLFTTLGHDAPAVPCGTESVDRKALYVVPAGRREPGSGLGLG